MEILAILTQQSSMINASTWPTVCGLAVSANHADMGSSSWDSGVHLKSFIHLTISCFTALHTVIHFYEFIRLPSACFVDRNKENQSNRSNNVIFLLFFFFRGARFMGRIG